MRKQLLPLVVFFSLCSIKGIAQTTGSDGPGVRLGNLETNSATLEQALQFPRLVVMNPTCIVSEFTVSIIPKGKEIIGPFKTKGAKLTEAEIKLIKDNNNGNTRLFFEDISVGCGSGETKGASLEININQ